MSWPNCQCVTCRTQRAAPDLLKAAKRLIALHDELAQETDDGAIDSAFDRWDASITELMAAVAKAEG